MNHRAYYQASITTFLSENNESILGKLSQNHLNHSLEDLQRRTWDKQIQILKEQLQNINGFIFFEFSIPRMGKRVDNIIIIGGYIFVIEFKIGAKHYEKHAINQVIDYCLDLKNFHKGSHNAKLIPVLVAEKAPNNPNFDFNLAQNFQAAIHINAKQLNILLNTVSQNTIINPNDWANSPYQPTPTIIEAAQALYQGHDVQDITRSDAGIHNLSQTNTCLNQIIEYAKAHHQKTICFVTGVPGAGKTLAGLNIANQRMNIAEEEHAVFLSGNGPLVNVLREALMRDAVAQSHSKLKKSTVRPKVEAFIQNIHHFRDEYLKDLTAPIEKVVIFDEAQRAWNKEQAASFMKRKRNKEDFNQSEPQFLIEVMNRHQDWCVIICLIGGGQEINTGEAGLSEWIVALKHHFKDWKIYYSPLIHQAEYLNDELLNDYLENKGQKQNSLHLATSVRSFRSEQLSHFINELLKNNQESAKNLYQTIAKDYPIVLTRDLLLAKQWLVEQAKGSERYGLLASSGARRLKAFGIDCKNDIDETYWFLNDKDDVRSAYFLEDVATEFCVQGLELDYACVAWDANFYRENGQWHYQNFKGSTWQKIKNISNQNYLLNAYRVLLTRARQGMVIFIPTGCSKDNTRLAKYYDETFEYLKSLGISEIVK
ncbi:hypothetical protein MHD_06710 [Mannheimia granulomatis]|uniref:Schlafen group 3-like DNA/RNA helicase domain-containing protein n=1 Tax=Mannheimia granulomatis TaxID=85402 RepID=A0A011NEF0_9PAST|nr:DUF2075 domain-containing protein [Mannheimia granulomatis]EXI62810.1 hypothetical protein AK33_03440 [Mannheimia granulomatis]RGE48166.1 hypothetical protein MHD_06710 [Mannheimia granulomatis]